MLHRYTLEKMRAIYLNETPSSCGNNAAAVCSFNTELMSLGYILSREAYGTLCALPLDVLVQLRETTIDHARDIVGDKYEYVPFYPNFPEQVMNASDEELLFNALLHYWTAGEWVPTYPTEVRREAMERGTYIPLDIANDADLTLRVQRLMGSSDSLPSQDVAFIAYQLTRAPETEISSVPFKENACVVAGTLLKEGSDCSSIVKTTVDVLRLAVYLSGGDTTLSTAPRFKSFKRSTRKQLLTLLENVVRSEDVQRHAGWWVRLFHSLHIGDYAGKFPKSYQAASKVRSNKRVKTFGGKLQEAYLAQDVDKVLALAKQRPGIFARNMGSYLRTFGGNYRKINNAFKEVVDTIATRNLVSLWGFLKTCDMVSDHIMVPSKTGKVKLQQCERETIQRKHADAIIATIKSSLITRFGQLPSFGKASIEETLYKSVVPTGMRSAPSGKLTVAKGTRLPMDNKNFTRLFCFWDDKHNHVDLDLSCSFVDSNFTQKAHCSYSDLRAGGNYYRDADDECYAVHSGDFVSSGPKGATEYIDINQEKALQAGIRYAIMSVIYYNGYGTNFDTINTCFMGWMSREDQNLGEQFDPKTIQQKVDIRGDGRVAVPVVFDLVENTAIWLDMQNIGNLGSYSDISSHGNIHSLMMYNVMNNIGKVTLGELYELHVEARGELVDVTDEADVRFTTFPTGSETDVSVFDYDKILSEFI